MVAHGSDGFATLRRENEVLRQRVSELERALARFGHASQTPELGRGIGEREALLAEAEKIAVMGSWIWDVSSDRVIWSDGLYRILGYDPAIDAASTEAFFARVHPEDLDRVSETSRRGIETGVSEHVEFRVRLPGGTVRHVGMDGALLFDAAGKLQRAVGTVLDVTDARRNVREIERARRLLDETERITATGSWEWDVPNASFRWSKGLFQLLGFPEDATPSIPLFESVVHADDVEELRAKNRRALRLRQVEPYECRLVRNDGSVRRVRVMSEPLHDAAGTFTGFIGTIADVTQRADLEERLRQAQKMEAIGQLAGGIAHDFNNLLMIILGGIEEIRERAGASEALTDVESAARSAAGLTQRLLAFSRRAVVSPRVVDLKRVIGEIHPLLARALGEEVETRFEHGAHEYFASVDANQLQQILLNMGVNARDAMSGRGRLSISLHLVTLDGGAVPELPAADYVRVSVADTGHGMDAATLGRIFEPFFTTKPVGQGTGLGLSMVYGAVKQAGGSVEVASEPGRGTTFHLYFPSARPEGRAEPKAATPASSLRVLLVEDDAAVRRVLHRALRRAGSNVTEASGGQAALLEWERARGRFDLLVTDAAMPDARGEELAADLLTRNPSLRALLVTGYVDRALDVSTFRGRLRVLQKPFSNDTLADAIADLLPSG